MATLAGKAILFDGSNGSGLLFGDTWSYDGVRGSSFPQ
jgi:hypothetical protein